MNDPKKKNKKRSAFSNGVLMAMGLLLYIDLFGQPACDATTTLVTIDPDGGTFDSGVGADAGAFDAGFEVDGGPVDGGFEVDAGGVDSGAVVDSGSVMDSGTVVDSGAPGDCWSDAVGTHVTADDDCGAGTSTTLSIVSGNYVLTPFAGASGGQAFAPKPGSPNEATASDVLGKRNCTLTCTVVSGSGNNTLDLACGKGAQGKGKRCSQGYVHQ